MEYGIIVFKPFFCRVCRWTRRFSVPSAMECLTVLRFSVQRYGISYPLAFSLLMSRKEPSNLWCNTLAVSVKGHTYCEACVKAWTGPRRNPVCPECR